MTDVYDTDTGTVQSGLTPEQITAGFAAGALRFPKGKPVTFVSNDGRAFDLDPESPDFQSTMRDSRYQLADSETAAAVQDKREAAQHPVEAAVAGAARGATLGLSDVAMRMAMRKVLSDSGVSPEIRKKELARLRNLREENPVASGVSEFAGAVVPALIPGGQFALSGTLAKGGLAAERGVSGLAGSVATRLLGEGAQSALSRAAVKGIGGAAVGALEVGAMSAGQEISEEALGDHDLNAEKILAGAAHGLILGAEGGFVLGTGSSLIASTARGTVRMTKKAVQNMWQRVQGTELPERVASTYAKVAGKMVGPEHEQTIRNALSSTAEGRALRDAINKGDDIYEEAIPRIRASIDDNAKITDALQDYAVGSLKRSGIKRAISSANLDEAENGAQIVLRKLDDLADDIERSPALYPGTGAARKKIRDIVDEFSVQVDDAARAGGKDGAADMFIAMDKAKRQFGRLVQKTTRGDQSVYDTFNDVYNQFRNHLEDETLYGGAAKIQKEINAAWSPYIAASKKFRGSFMTKSGEQEGFLNLYTADPRKINSYIRSAGTAVSAADDEAFQRYIAFQQNLNETIAKHYQVPAELRASLAKSKANIQTMQRELNHVHDTIEHVNAWKALRQAEAESTDVLTPGGAILGGVLGGTPGAAVGAGIGRVARSLRSPSQAIRMRMAIEHLRDQWDSRIGSGVKRWVETAAEHGERIEHGAHRAHRAFDVAESSELDRVHRARSAARLAAAKVTASTYRNAVESVIHTSDPQTGTRRFADRTQGMNDAAPQTTNALALKTATAASFLRGKVPAQTTAMIGIQPLSNQMPPSSNEMAKFMRYVRTVTDPASILDDLRSHSVTPEAVEALKAVYPGIYDQVAQAALNAVSEQQRSLDYSAKVQLGTLLGITTDPTMDPAFIVRMQSLPSVIPQEPDNGEPAPAGGTPTRQTPPQVSAGHLTESQRIEGRS